MWKRKEIIRDKLSSTQKLRYIPIDTVVTILLNAKKTKIL